MVEHGITVAGKPLRDPLEAVDLFDALRWVRAVAGRRDAVTEMDLCRLHRLVMLRSDPEGAGRYADQGRYVLTDGGGHAFPSPAEVPALMGDLVDWLRTAPSTPETASAAHLRLVTIHPFNDGNGRTARLLMNLLLIRAGYPPVAVRPLDRPAYIAALQAAQAGLGADAFERLLSERLDATLAEYVAAAQDGATHRPG